MDSRLCNMSNRSENGNIYQLYDRAGPGKRNAWILSCPKEVL